MNISKILSYVVLAIGVVGAIMLFLMSNSFDALMDTYGITEAKDLVKDTGSAAFTDATALVTPMYGLTLIILVIIVIATLAAVVMALAKNPGGLKNTAIGIVAFLVILGISYVVADNSVFEMRDGEVLSENGSQLVGAGIYAFYILAIVAVGLMVLSGVKKLIK